MKAPRRRTRALFSQTEFSFEKLEDRRLLAGDFIQNVTDFVPVEDRYSYLRSHLNLQANESMQLIDLQRDEIGFAHFKYQQMFNDVPVENGVYSVHVQGGRVVTLSGNYVPILQAVAGRQGTVAEDVAFATALDHVGAEKYFWEGAADPALPGLADESSEGELVYFAPRGGDAVLAYKFEVWALEPFSGDEIFVDAISGTRVLGTKELIHGGDEAGTGTTLYDGVVDITVDRYNPGDGFEYRLREGQDGLEDERPIQTFDLRGATSSVGAFDYTSSTTDFSNSDVQNGVQLHFGSEQTYDYYLNTHNRNSIDGNGSILKTFGSYGTNFNNAFWSRNAAFFGDGDGVVLRPLTSLDVVGHEFTHGVIQFSADLDYSFQSGALNESFADIFGNAIERYARGTTDWLVGADVTINDPFRSMADPKLYGDPDTFMGDNWHPSSNTSDNGGVHTNSGVQNKWFYILTEGETGTNDLGWTYDVQGIGFDAAAAVAYRNLTVYLTSDSDYVDAREGAIQSAIDLFGAGSAEHLATDNAWFAVGLDEPVVPYGSLDGLFQPVRSLGSQVYRANVSGTVVAQSGDITDEGARSIYSLNLDANQTISAVVQGFGGFEPVVRIITGGEFFVDGTNYGEFGVTQAVEANTAELYTIAVSGGDSGTLGDFVLDVYLNAEIETEPFSGSGNNSRLTAQTIDFATVSLGSSAIANRIAVVGSIAADEADTSSGGGGSILFGEDFETGDFGSGWTTLSTPMLIGRIDVTDAYGAAGGDFSMIMDSEINGSFALNEAIWTVDLENVKNPHLNFGYMEWFDESDFIPDVFAGSVDGDGVAISDDGATWYTIQNSTQSTAGEWIFVSFDLVDFAAFTGLDISGDIQVKFQQYDNQPIDVADGRGFDEISISETPINGGGQGLGDWYAFEIKDQETVSLAVAGVNSFGSELQVELYNSFGILVASESAVETTNVESYISQFFNTTGLDDVFYARVSGDVADYNFVVTRGAEYNVEVIDESTTDITFLDGSLGYVSSGEELIAEPDDFPDDTVLDNAIFGLQFSNAVTGGSVYAEDVAGVMVPATGSKTFTPNLSGLHGWLEGDNELRVDFAEPQMIVSIDVVSNDNSVTTTDKAFLRAYSSDGTLLQEVESGDVSLFEVETITINRSVAEIAYIIAAGVGADETPLDNLVYQTTVDVDVYSFDAIVGQRLAFRGFLPGMGPNEFANGLDQETGSALRLSLFDPTGAAVDFGSTIVQTIAVVGGTYELRVMADSGAGEYYVGLESGLGIDGVDFGPLGSAVWEDYAFVNDDVYSVGLGYGWTNTDDLTFFENLRGNDLIVDFARVRSGTFVIDVPNGTYDVEVHLGQIRRSETSRITVEGFDDVFAPRAGPNVSRHYVTSVADGQLTIEFSGEGGLLPYINIAGISISEADSGGRFVVPTGIQHDEPTRSLVNSWNIGDSVVGSKTDRNGVREIPAVVANDSGGRILPGSNQLIEHDAHRDRRFAKIYTSEKTLAIEELGEIEIEGLVQAKSDRTTGKRF